MCSSLFFFNDTATTEIYTLSLHDALPIWACWFFEGPADLGFSRAGLPLGLGLGACASSLRSSRTRSEEHTSELQSRQYLVCRLLLEKKTINQNSLSRIPDVLGCTCMPILT